MAKKIKSFTVDEDTYKALIEMFKKYKVDGSISMFLDRALKDLLTYCRLVERELEGYPDHYSVPMQYIMNETVKGEVIRIPSEAPRDQISELSDLDLTLEDWQTGYDAEQKGIPRDLYELMRCGNYVLSADKKYVIDNGTGIKYTVVNGEIMELVETKK